MLQILIQFLHDPWYNISPSVRTALPKGANLKRSQKDYIQRSFSHVLAYDFKLGNFIDLLDIRCFMLINRGR